MTTYDLRKAMVHVNGIHSAPIITIDFDTAQKGMDDLASKLVLLFKGEVLFVDEKHIVVKTDRTIFENVIKDNLIFFDERT